MRSPGKEPSLGDMESGSAFSTKAWILIFFGILFILYAFTPPVREAVNSTLGGVLSPLIQLGEQAMMGFKYLG